MSKLIPYVEKDGEWSIPDPLMLGIYNKMVEQNLIDIVFVNGTVRDEESWMRFIKNKSNLIHVEGNEKFVEGIAWLNSFGHNYAFAHFCIFQEMWGKDTVPLGEKTLTYWFSLNDRGNALLDVILCQLPTSNNFAVSYIKKLGFNILGEIPQIRYSHNKNMAGATFGYLSREEFHNG